MGQTPLVFRPFHSPASRFRRYRGFCPTPINRPFTSANLNLSTLSQPTVIAQRIETFICPSDANVQLSSNTPPTFPTCYGANIGDWFTENFSTGQFGNGTFPYISYPNQQGIRLADITDGTSTTVGFADVKAFTSFLTRSTTAPSLPVPTNGADVLALGGTIPALGGHVSWAEEFAVESGLTFVLAPNTSVLFVNPADGTTHDVDWQGGPVYQFESVTARSYHPGGVNALFMDGSVRFITNSIPQATCAPLALAMAVRPW